MAGPWEAYQGASDKTLKERDTEAGIAQKGASAAASEASAASSAATAEKTRTLLPSEARKSKAEATKAELDVEKAELALAKTRAALANRPAPEGLDDVRRAISVELKNALEAKRLSREMFGASGIGHTTTSLISGSPGASVSALLKPIQANTAFNKLQDMRAKSPTGGALGAVSDAELKLLYSSEDALEPTAGDEVFQNSLDTIIGNRVAALMKLGADPYEVAQMIPQEELPRYADRFRAYRLLDSDTAALQKYVDTSRKDGTYDPQVFSALMGEAYYNATGRKPDDEFIKRTYQIGVQLADPGAGISGFDYAQADKEVLERISSGQFAKPEEGLSWGSAVGGAAINAVPSTFEFAFDTAKALTADLPDTLEGVVKVVGGATGLSDPEAYEAVKQYYVGRYGTIDGFKKALQTDPASIAADIAGIASGGGTIAAKTANLGAKVSKIRALSDAARAAEGFATAAAKFDPLNAAAAMTRKGADLATAGLEATAINIPARQAGVTGADVKQAFGAGRRNSQEFLDQMRGNADPADPLTKARAAVGELYAARSADYTRRMAKMNKTEVLDWKDVEDAISAVENVGRYKGIDISAASGVWEDIFNIADQFKAKGLNTIEDFDAMKRAMFNIKDKYQVGTPEHKVAKDVAAAINKTIVEKAPVYANIMKDYRIASDVLSDVQSTLSLGAGSADTALTKLQRTASGRGPRGRTVLDLLEGTKSGKGLGDMLAGKAMAATEQQGLAGSLAGPTALLTGSPEALAGAMVTPRVLGERAYGLGQKYGAAERAVQAVRQQPFAQRLEQMAAKYAPTAQRALTAANPALIQPQVDPFEAPRRGPTPNALAARYGIPVPRAIRSPVSVRLQDLYEQYSGPSLMDYVPDVPEEAPEEGL